MANLRRLFGSRMFGVVLIGALVGAAVILLRIAGNLESVELACYDWFVRLHTARADAPAPIVIVSISDDDIGTLGRWPLSDATLARVLDTLSDYQPRAIGVDIFRDTPVPPGSDALDAVLRGNPRIVVVTKFGGVGPPAVLQGTEQVGFNDVIVDPGGTARRGLLFLDDGTTVSYSFALRLALLQLQPDGIQPRPDPLEPSHIQLGQATMVPFEADDGPYARADARGYQFLLDFEGGPAAFPEVSLSALLAGDGELEQVRDQVVLIGVKAQSVKDYFYTPHSLGFQASQQVFGVYLHAHAVSQLLRMAHGRSRPIAFAGGPLETLIILGWSFLGSALALVMRSPARFTVLGAAGLLAIWGSGYTLFRGGYWIPVFPPSLTWVVAAAVMTAFLSKLERAQRGLLMQLFSKHVSNEVARAIWEQRDEFLDRGRPRSQQLTATVLFSDLRGFTGVSEALGAQALMDWLNEYMDAMADLIARHGGVVDDYAGDGIKANFGVPFARTTEEEIRADAVNAVACALAMEREMEELNRRWQKREQPQVRMRVGIYTGPVVAGAIGSAERLKYTTVGDTVNTAARLESYDKEIGQDALCRILIGESTLACLRDRFTTRLVGEAKLKGKGQKVTVYRVFGPQEEGSGIPTAEVAP